MSQRSIPAVLISLALLAGCGQSAEDALQELEESGVEFSAEAFVRSAEAGDARAVELFLVAEMDLDARRARREETALMAASRGDSQSDTGGHPQIVRMLLAAGADPNLRNDWPRTVLMIALNSMKTSLEVVEALLEAGADPNLGSERSTPLNLVAWNGREDFARALLEHGADAKASSQALSATLGDLTREPRIEIMRWLLEEGADPNVRDRLGVTPLIEAAELGRYEAVELLLEHDADVTLRTNHGRSALGVAKFELGRAQSRDELFPDTSWLRDEDDIHMARALSRVPTKNLEAVVELLEDADAPE